MGAAYIIKGTPKVTRNARSLYFVVIDVINNPKPRLNIAIIANKKGIRKIQKLGDTDFLKRK
jgi:hypothetical protein